MPSISYRALIRMGDGGLVITIPRAWARFYQLQPGQKVEVIANGELLVRPQGKSGRKSKKMSPPTQRGSKSA